MKIVHAFPAIDRRSGGPIEALIGLAGAQVQAGHSVVVVTSARRVDKSDTLSDFAALGVEVCVAAPAYSKVFWVPRLRPQVEVALRGASVIHCHSIWEFFNYDVAKLGTELGIPYIVRPCGMLHPWCLDQHHLLKQFLRRFRGDEYLRRSRLLHFTTTHECNHIPSEFRAHPYVIVPNGVSLDQSKELTAGLTSIWDRLPTLLSKRRLLYLGRVHPIKRIELVIEALALLGRRDVALAIAGGGNTHYGEQLDRLAASKGLSDQVVRVGPIYGKEKLAALAGAEIFVLTSQHENFGVSVAEALSSGVPVVVSDQVALSEEVLAAGAGRVTGLNAGQVSAALQELLDDRDAYQSAVQGATSLGRSAFDWTPIAARWTSIYTSLVNGTPIDRSIAGRP